MKPDATALFEALADLLADRVVERLASKPSPDGPALLAVDLALGCTRRHAAELCRAKRITGAVLVAKRWSAPRASIDAYVASLAEGRQGADDDNNASLRKLAAEMGLRVAS